MILGEAIDLRYFNPGRIIFRIPKGKSPIVPYSILTHEKKELTLIGCFYLKSGRQTVFTLDQEIIPLKFMSLEDDEEFLTPDDKYNIKHLGCMNWPNCDLVGCGAPQ